MKLTKEEGREIVDCYHEDWEQVEKSIANTSRWSIHYEAIHKHIPSGKFYSFEYSRGATESQEEYPYEYDDEVTPVEVHQVEKLMTVWEPVGE